MRTTVIACTLALLAPAAAPIAALAASAPGPSHNVPPPKCSATVGLPALDAGSKDAAKMSVKLRPEFTRGKKGSGKTTSANIGSQSSGVGAGKVQSCGGRVMDDESPKESVH